MALTLEDMNKIAHLSRVGLSDDEKTKRRGQHISFIFQAFHLLPHLTVEENILLPIQLNNIKQRYSVEEILEKV